MQTTKGNQSEEPKDNLTEIKDMPAAEKPDEEPAVSEERAGSHAWDVLCLAVLLILVIICFYLLLQ